MRGERVGGGREEGRKEGKEELKEGGRGMVRVKEGEGEGPITFINPHYATLHYSSKDNIAP